MPKTKAPSPTASDRVRQVALDHHDEQQHEGSQRFCTEAPCRELNAVLADWWLW